MINIRSQFTLAQKGSSRGVKQPDTPGSAGVGDVTGRQSTAEGGGAVEKGVVAGEVVAAVGELGGGDEDDFAVVEEMSGEEGVVAVVLAGRQLAHLHRLPAVDEVVGCDSNDIKVGYARHKHTSLSSLVIHHLSHAEHILPPSLNDLKQFSSTIKSFVSCSSQRTIRSQI